MHINLVGGFLGSGKTTAIINAAKYLTASKIKTGVITNDQGKFLIDSQFVKLSGIANAEVTGGCFCCNYDALDEQINFLRNEINPDEIFAESVGSCTDLIATVVKPMLKFQHYNIQKITYSGFVDARILLNHLRGEALPFTAETNYIWLKQIEEAEILVVNKSDLLSVNELSSLKSLADSKYTGKTILYQNSLDNHSIKNWLDALNSFNKLQTRKTIEVDYDKYGAGEADLAWLDEEIVFNTLGNDAVKTAIGFIDETITRIEKSRLPVGHIKFLLSTPYSSQKISFTTIPSADWQKSVTLAESDSIKIMINARVQTTPDNLRSIIKDSVESIKLLVQPGITESNVTYFQPGFPNPTHRIND